MRFSRGSGFHLCAHFAISSDLAGMEDKAHLKKHADPHPHTDAWVLGNLTYCWFQLELTLFLQNQFLFMEAVQTPGWPGDRLKRKKKDQDKCTMERQKQNMRFSSH